MTEREQLELCAKASGVVGKWVDKGETSPYVKGGFCIGVSGCSCEEKNCCCDPLTYWNPKHDDGDCARLEAKLGIDVEWHVGYVLCTRDVAYWEAQDYSDHAGDKQAARRAAVCAVAAEIGRGLNDG